MESTRIGVFRRALSGWFDKEQRPLPWRETTDPYRTWVSEVMLQQTRVRTVVPYYLGFLKRFPDAASLAETDPQDILKVWEGLGYYSRARNLQKAARIVCADYDGRVPANETDFLKLPGVGEYICAAVQSIAFNKALPVVDGNVKRVLARLFMMRHPVNKSSSLRHFRRQANRLLDADAPGNHNQAMMELGATICKPKVPDCYACPVSEFCKSFAEKTVARFPRRLKNKPKPIHHIAVGVVYRDDRILITLRKPDGLLGGLWEFPGGKVRQGETAEKACLREIEEEVNLEVEVDFYLTRIKHAYSHFGIEMDVFVCKYVSGRVVLNGAVDHKWIRCDQIDDYPFPTANRKFIPLLALGGAWGSVKNNFI